MKQESHVLLILMVFSIALRKHTLFSRGLKASDKTLSFFTPQEQLHEE